MLYDPGKRQPHKSREYADGKGKRGIVYQKKGDGNGVNKNGLPCSIKKKGIEFVFWPALVEKVFACEFGKKQAEIYYTSRANKYSPNGNKIGKENAGCANQGPNNKTCQGSG